MRPGWEAALWPLWQSINFYRAPINGQPLFSKTLRAGYVREAQVPPESQSRIDPNPSPGQPLSAGATKAQIEPWPQIDFPKMGILEVDKSRPIPKLAQDGNDENFTKKGVLEKKCRSHRKSGLGPSDFSFEKS